MEETPSFSARHGYTAPGPEIVIRHEAPVWLREFVVRLAYECELHPSGLRGILCGLLFEAPNRSNWSEFPNIDAEVSQLLAGAEWFQVYDFIETIAETLLHPETRFNPLAGDTNPQLERFTEKLNVAFRRKGVGWQLVDRRIQIRGPESFEVAVKQSNDVLLASGRQIASHEIHEALVDLSRRPTPDITGAIQHAMAALECVARDVAGEPKATLGELLKKHPELLPAPLDNALSKIWGFASEQGRHLRENEAPDIKEAELVVGLAGSLNLFGEEILSGIKRMSGEPYLRMICSGWSDLDLGHEFHATKQGERYTFSESARRTVLDRLIALNHQRYEEEVKAGLHEKGKNIRRKPSAGMSSQLELIASAQNEFFQ